MHEVPADHRGVRQTLPPNPFWALRLVAAILADHPAIATAVPADSGLTPAVDVITHDGEPFRLVVDVGDRREEITRLFADVRRHEIRRDYAMPRPQGTPPRGCGAVHDGECIHEAGDTR